MRTRKTKRYLTLIKIISVWVVAIIITSPITSLGILYPENISPTPKFCGISNIYFYIFGSVFAFYIPMFIMIGSYILTVNLLRDKMEVAQTPERRRKFSRKISLPQPSEKALIETHNIQKLKQSIKRQTTYSFECGNENPSTKKCSLPTGQVLRRKKIHKNRKQGNKAQLRRQSSENGLLNKQRATKVLGLVFLAFLVCWTPFFILNIYSSTCFPNCEYASFLPELCLWLGYLSSILNPIIYTVFSRNFKQGFLRLFHCENKGKIISNMSFTETLNISVSRRNSSFV